MKLIYYKQVDAFWVAEEMKKRMEFTPYQKQKLTDVIHDLPYRFIKFEKDKKSSSFLYRLTIVFYLIFILIAWIVALFQWFFTGNRYYNNKDFIARIYISWSKKLNFY